MAGDYGRHYRCDRCDEACDARIKYGSYWVCGKCWEKLDG